MKIWKIIRKMGDLKIKFENWNFEKLFENGNYGNFGKLFKFWKLEIWRIVLEWNFRKLFENGNFENWNFGELFENGIS